MTLQPPPATELRSVLIVGGGISGLTAAYDLRRSGLRCTLIEPNRRLGGVIVTDRVEGCLMEGGPDSFIAQKPWALELIRELGLGDEVIGSNDAARKTYILRNGRLVPLPDGIQFLAPTKILPVLKTPLLSLKTKAAMALEWFRRPRPDTGDRSVADFVRDHYGDEANEYLAQPMLAGVYGGSPELLSINSVLPRFVEMERRYGSLSRALFAARRQSKAGEPSGSLFLTLRGGMQTLVDKLVAEIGDSVRVVPNRAVSISSSDAGYSLNLADGATLQGDRLILATPAWQSAELLRNADPGLADSLGSIPYGSCITGALIYQRPEFKRPLDGFGFLVPRAERRLLSACTWVNTKFSNRAPDDKPLLRAFIAGEKADAMLAKPDDELERAIDSDLQQMMGFEARPIASTFSRWERSMAQYQVGHARTVDAINERLKTHPGLYLCGNGYDGIGVPDCIRRSRAAVRSILQQPLPTAVSTPIEADASDSQ
jgi:protoporphyrinogen/coproporphyrinogen III oxidase